MRSRKAELISRTQSIASAAGLDRRSLLRLAGGSLGGACAGWSSILNASPSGRSKARSVIMIFNCGAPSHHDLWDPKPQAPDDVRGIFSTIDTNVPGIQVSELIPELAKRADKLALVRTVHHRHGGHNSGMYWSTVGRPYRVDSTLINPSPTDYPCFGTLVGWLAQQDNYSGDVPPYVITPTPHCDSSVYLTPGQYGGCLGIKYDPFVLNADPNANDFRVRNLQLVEGLTQARLDDRHALRSRLDERGRRM
ncbi:MAG: hypothetical protein RIS70_3670, partial [Planctomycetota bacterium]